MYPDEVIRTASGAEAIVVGSGPSGVACALALLDAGRDVLMLDVGLGLEPERREALRQMRQFPQELWRNSGQLKFMTEGMSADLSGVPLKLVYGSDYPYRSLPGIPALEINDAYLQVSLACGGFSTVWGSSLLPYRQQDMLGWPVSQEELSPHYRAVLEEVPMAGHEDDLAALFPLYTTPSRPLISAQARGLLETMAKNRDSLRREGIYAGASRIAVQVAADPGCTQCGICMFGCPFELIYSSAFTVERLRSHPRFRYIPDVYVNFVEESGAGVRVSSRHARTGEELSFEGERIFLAAGAISTTKILLRSLGAFGLPVTLLDSGYFLQPSLRIAGVPNVRQESLHTLTQAFIEILDPEISRHIVHLQVYTYNTLFERALIGAAGSLHGFLPKGAMLSRLLLLQGFIHSSESASMICCLEKTSTGDFLRVKGQELRKAAQVIKRVQKKLLSVSHLTGLIPLLPLLRPGDPGRSFHIGGTFPMTDSPGDLQTDRLGRPKGFSRVHAVDSTVFPSIAATTITLTSMANAHRIGASSWLSTF